MMSTLGAQNWYENGKDAVFDHEENYNNEIPEENLSIKDDDNERMSNADAGDGIGLVLDQDTMMITIPQDIFIPRNENGELLDNDDYSDAFTNDYEDFDLFHYAVVNESNDQQQERPLEGQSVCWSIQSDLRRLDDLEMCMTKELLDFENLWEEQSLQQQDDTNNKNVIMTMYNNFSTNIQQLFQTLAIILFGNHMYNVKPMFDDYEALSLLPLASSGGLIVPLYQRSRQGTIQVYMAATVFFFQMLPKSWLLRIPLALILSAVATFTQIYLPHRLDESMIALVLLSFSVFWNVIT